jgi:hypothetical protein
MSEPEIITSPETNWSSFLEQVERDYNTSPAFGIAHGLQKDAIQNGWGARISDRNWSFEFALKKMPDGTLLLTMTDYGTCGLIGSTCYFDEHKTRPDEEISKIPDNERLARFESMFYSGGTGPGLFGRGKLIFNVASRQKLIFYDSHTISNEYRLNKRQIKASKYQQYKHVFQGDTARTKISEWTNGTLQPLTCSGTRITIVDPVQEVVDAIHDGTFLKAIEETWWEIIQKYDAKITMTDEDSRTYIAQVPREFSSLPKESKNGWRIYYKQNVEVKIGEDVYKIKHLHLLLAPAGHVLRSELQGVSVYRRGMKIGLLPLEVPEEIKDRFFGYIQLNPDFEDLIAEVEITTHYGFASTRKPPIKDLRNTVRADFDIFMQQLGFGPNLREANEKAKRILDKAKADLDSILRDMNVPGFGTGRSPRSDVSISVEDLVFPGDSNYVKIGTVISGFKYKITNRSGGPKQIFLEVVTHESDIGVIETLLPRKEIRVKDTYETDELMLSVKEGIYPRGKKVGCTASVSDERKNKLCEKTFYIYVEVTPQPIEELASIVFCSADWPREKSRRVDFGQSIRNLTYEVENLTPLLMKMKLKVGTVWAEERERIEDVYEVEMTLTPFEKKGFVVPEVTLTKEKYSEVGKAKMILRCHAVALEATSMWENRRKLDVNDVIFYLNKDPGYGFFEDPDYNQDGPTKPRSIAKPMEGIKRWKISINSTHPAYEAVKTDDILAEEYVFGEMARQTVFVLLRREDANEIRKLAKLAATQNPDEMDSSEVLGLLAYPITDQILSKYYSARK